MELHRLWDKIQTLEKDTNFSKMGPKIIFPSSNPIIHIIVEEPRPTRPLAFLRFYLPWLSPPPMLFLLPVTLSFGAWELPHFL
jgi:hypothetical protein